MQYLHTVDSTQSEVGLSRSALLMYGRVPSHSTIGDPGLAEETNETETGENKMDP